MTLNEANKLYESVSPPNLFIAFAIGILIFYISRLIFKKVLKDSVLIFILPFIPAFLAMMAISIMMAINFGEHKEEWKETVKTEYIDNLPIEKVEVVKYKAIGKRVSEGRMKIKFTYIYKTLEAEETLVATIKPVKGLKKPYMEFQFLDRNLPLDNDYIILKKGYYNPVLYVPE
jgi:hypothetical protein